MGNFLQKLIEAGITQSLLGIFKGKLVHIITAIFLSGISVFLSYISPAFYFFGYSLIIPWICTIFYLWYCLVHIKQSLHSKKQMSEIEMEERSLDVQLNVDRDKQMDVILLNLVDNPEDHLAGMNKCLVLSRGMPERKKDIVINAAKQICGDNPTELQKSLLYTLLDKYEPFRDEINNLLQTKGYEAIRNQKISKKAIEFLSSITDTDLGILKKQFKYVQEGAGIPLFDSTIDFIAKVDSDAVSDSYSLKFYGDIWKDEYHSAGGKARVFKKEQFAHCELVEISGKQYNNIYAFKVINRGHDIIMIIPEQHYAQFNGIEIPYYVALTDVGREVYNLLKDEIENTPIEFAEKHIQHLRKQYPNYQFVLNKT